MRSSTEPNEVRILDPQVRDHMDTFRVVFTRSAKYTIFPELMEIFGADKVVRFLEIFGGMTIRVPRREFLEQAVRDTDIYVAISRHDAPETTDRLAVRYEIPRETVRDIYLRVKALREEMGL